MDGKTSPKDVKSLEDLRERIDALDAQILELLNQRARIAIDVGDVKRAAEAAPQFFRPEREAQVIRRLSEANTGPLPTEGVANIFREVMSACRALEHTAVVAYLGPEGTYSEQAVIRQFGRSVERRGCASIDEIFREVEAKAADFGVIPIENSTEGTVNRSLDLLLNSPLRICGEISLAIHHHLLTRSGTLTADGVAVTRVCAHPQALAQCTDWLDRHHPTLERVPVASNGLAAKLASEDPTFAAIAGDLAIERYGLLAVATNIQDLARNTTRFGVIGSISTTPSGRDQTSFVFSVANQAGAVHEAIEPLARHDVSMTRFESRPARTGVWVYHFYIDVEGHETEPGVAAALAELKGRAGFFKILGSYPLA
jgi:chorismate mutase / prephenate dehydratase